MREIKFRAWDSLKKRMVFDVQNTYDNLSTGCDTRDYNIACFGDLLESKRWIVMQFTGLQDKNGKEIYEWDVVKNYHGENLEVKIPDVYVDDAEYGLHYTMGEIIGNIHENPELLEGKL